MGVGTAPYVLLSVFFLGREEGINLGSCTLQKKPILKNAKIDHSVKKI